MANNLSKKDVELNSEYKLHYNQEETIDHILLSYPYSTAIWFYLSHSCNLRQLTEHICDVWNNRLTDRLNNHWEKPSLLLLIAH